MTLATKPCPSCAQSLPLEAAFCMMCGAATPHAIDKNTGEMVIMTDGRLPSPDKTRLQRALGGNYELGKLIGRGGFAEVFLVHDKRLKRDLALKALRPDLIISEHLLTRFRREAETVAALRHPHIVPIYDIGEADGIAYILMPLIQGESLRALMHREGPRPVREAMRIMLEAADALDAAHDAGVVHRDIKPENIMLEGKGRRVQLMDFGIAKAIDKSDNTPGLTSTGMLVGTPHYMSPEQASGEANLDHRSDQYSLAVVSYQMITGSLPFDGESTRAVLFQQMVGVPKSLRDLVPDVPATLAFAVDRALSKDPKDRFESMEALSEAIAGPDAWPLLSTGSTDAVAAPSIGSGAVTSPTVPVPKPAGRRRRVLPIGLGIGTVAGVVAAVLLLRPPAVPDGATAGATDSTGASGSVLATAAPATDSAGTSGVVGNPAVPAPAPPPAATSLAGAQPPGATRPAAATTSRPAPPPPPAAAAQTCQAAATARRWDQAASVCATEAESGKSGAARILAGMYQRGDGVERSDSLAASWYRKAVTGGDAQAAYRLAIMYANGTGLTQNDVEATALFRTAADGGVPEAWPLLAERYEQGLGIRRSDQEAAFWYRRAADEGNRAAQFNLGEMYNRGRGVQKSENEAAVWFSRAAEQGHPGAEYELGMMYIRGRGGLAKDETVGLEWLERAARQGHPEATKEAEKRRRP